MSRRLRLIRHPLRPARVLWKELGPLLVRTNTHAMTLESVHASIYECAPDGRAGVHVGSLRLLRETWDVLPDHEEK